MDGVREAKVADTQARASMGSRRPRLRTKRDGAGETAPGMAVDSRVGWAEGTESPAGASSTGIRRGWWRCRRAADSATVRCRD